MKMWVICTGISIHALLAESDTTQTKQTEVHIIFLSTLSLRRATMHALELADTMLFLSTLSLRRATTTQTKQTEVHIIFLSTLSLRRATMHALELADTMLFLSTLSLRRATRLPTALRTPHQRFLSTLSLRRATQEFACIAWQSTISIHALLAESDVNFHAKARKSQDFYPRSPCGERHNAYRDFGA